MEKKLEKNEIFDRLRKVLAESLCVDLEVISISSDFFVDFDTDESEMLSVAMGIMNEFDIKILVDELKKNMIISDLVNWIEENQK